MKRSTNLWLTAAFVALAGYGLYKGFQAQSKTDTPLKQTAYSYSSEKNGTASGTVGTPKVGLEYEVNNFSQPKVKVATKVEDLYARVNFDSKTGKQDFFAQTDVNDEGETIKAQTTFKGNSSRVKVDYNKAIKDPLLNSFGLSYTENIGKKSEQKLSANFTIDLAWIGIRPMIWSPTYAFGQGFDFSKFRRA